MTSSTLSGESMSRDVAQLAGRHPAVVAMARLGWVAKGIVYGLVGVLAVRIAIQGLRADRTRNGDQEASPLGAVTEIAETSLGAIALWVVAVGLALYVLWRLISIVLPAENTVSDVADPSRLRRQRCDGTRYWRGRRCRSPPTSGRPEGPRPKTPRSSGSPGN